MSSNVMYARKKPVQVEVLQFLGTVDSFLEVLGWMKDSGNTHALADEIRYETPLMLIPTLEGTMAANPGDWIIRGVQSEFYPCKPDIFDETYELQSYKVWPRGTVTDMVEGWSNSE